MKKKPDLDNNAAAYCHKINTWGGGYLTIDWKSEAHKSIASISDDEGRPCSVISGPVQDKEAACLSGLLKYLCPKCEKAYYRGVTGVQEACLKYGWNLERVMIGKTYDLFKIERT